MKIRSRHFSGFHLFPLLFTLFITVWFGCSNNSTTPSNTLSFTINSQQSGNSTEFYFNPNMNVKVVKVIIKLPSPNNPDTIVSSSPQQVYNSGTNYPIASFSGVPSGSQWVFVFSGTLASNNSSYTSTAGYIVP